MPASSSKITRTACLAIGFALAISGCAPTTLAQLQPPVAAPAASPSGAPQTADLPSQDPLHAALEEFDRRDYGLAERNFRQAVENQPNNVGAWMGLAATYDELGRFDLADRAYDSAAKLGGQTTELLNNLGYSYMLRGDFGKARKEMLEALRRDPRNPMILNNLELLKVRERAQSGRAH